MKKLIFTFGILAAPFLSQAQLWIRGDSLFVALDNVPSAPGYYGVQDAVHVGNFNEPNTRKGDLVFEENGWCLNRYGWITVTGDVVNMNLPRPNLFDDFWTGPDRNPFVYGSARTSSLNATLIPTRGTVQLYNNDTVQAIRSTTNAYIRFNNLRLRGKLAYRKELKIDALTDSFQIGNSLRLVDPVHFHLGTYKMVVESNNPNAIDANDDAYISADQTLMANPNYGYGTIHPRPGRLVRYNAGAIDPTDPYNYPVGDSVLAQTPRRDVDLTPGVATGRYYAVRAVGNDPQIDGWMRDDKHRADTTTCEVNNKYYHIIEDVTNLRYDNLTDPNKTTLNYDLVTPTPQSATANLKIYHYDDSPVRWDDLVNYNGPNDRWETMNAKITAGPDYWGSIDGWNQFTDDQVFAFGAKKPTGGIVLPTPSDETKGCQVLYEFFVVGETVKFTPNPKDVTDDFFAHEWDFGDKQTSAEPNPEHIYLEPKDYTVKHTVYNPNFPDCKKVDCITVRVTPKFAIVLPDAIKPGDPNFINHEFTAYIFGVNSIDFKVFNRWGQSIWQYNQSHNPREYKVKLWDGKTTGGSDCPEGVYVYVLKAIRDEDGKEFQKTGSITLFR